MKTVTMNRKIHNALPHLMATACLVMFSTIAQAAQHPMTPHNNQSMAEVLFLFGQPAKKLAAVGKPPVSRWRYPGFTVYFEYQRVITTVLDNDLYPASS